MSVSFDHGTAVLDLARRTRDLVSEVVIPVEREWNGSGHDLPDDTRRRQQQAARDTGVFALHVSLEYGGYGLDMRSRAAVFEAAGYSLFGPLALNGAAPDEGNMHLIERIADDGQKECYLRPLAAGEVTSCFAMTEPAPGAGSDPRALSTTARRVGRGWVINGDKWFTTGADRAAFAIVMARTSGEQPSGQICSITKTFVSEAVNRVVDRAVQVCGALGISGDTALAQLSREIRPFRIYDGPSETHRWVIAKRAIRTNQDEWRSHCGRLERVNRGSV